MTVYDPVNDNPKPMILPRRGKKDQPLVPGVSPLPNPKRSPMPGTTPTRSGPKDGDGPGG